MQLKKLCDHYENLIETDARFFLYHCYLGGFKFGVEDGRIRVSPRSQVDDEMVESIRKHKPELIRLLTIHDDGAINELCDQCHQEINNFEETQCK